MAGVYIFDIVLIVFCIVLCVVGRIGRDKKIQLWKIVLGYVISISSICAGLLQQLLTFVISLFLISLSDGNSFTDEASNTIFFLLLLPVAMIASSIVCLVMTKKLSNYRRSLNRD